MSPLFQHPALWFVAVPRSLHADRGGMGHAHGAQTSLGQSTVRPLVHASHSTNEACNKLRFGEDAYCRRHACMEAGYSELDKLKVSLRTCTSVSSSQGRTRSRATGSRAAIPPCLHSSGQALPV